MAIPAWKTLDKQAVLDLLRSLRRQLRTVTPDTSKQLLGHERTEQHIAKALVGADVWLA
jgi:hypothetical protein